MLSYVVEFLNFVFDTLALCYQVVVFIGFGIVCFLNSVIQWLAIILRTFFMIIIVLLEDFGKFLGEANDIIVEIGCCIDDLLHTFDESYGSHLKPAFSVVVDTFKFVVRKQIRLVQNIIHFFDNFMRLVIDALTLIGSLAKESFGLLFIFLYNVITAPFTSFINLCFAIYNACLCIIDIVLNLPVESGIGFCVVLLAITLYRKYNGTKIMKTLLRLTILLIYQVFVLLITSCFVVKCYIVRFLKKIKQSTHKFYKKKARTESPSKIELMKKLDQELSLRMCVICMSNPRDVVIMNCQHFCMCNSCARQIRYINNECPVCRKHIYRLYQVYT